MKIDPKEQRLKAVQRRFRAARARQFLYAVPKQKLTFKIYAIGIITFTIALTGLLMSPWPVLMTLRHLGSAPDCHFARMFGLAPANKGEPGYYYRHDADGDGISCEPLKDRQY